MSKSSEQYAPIGQHLAQQQEETCKLTFEEIEALLGFKLPFAARTLRPFWSLAKYPHIRGWSERGWEVERVDFILETVTFKRVKSKKRRD